ncbi:MAG: LysM peptidoglycan-binding domain-containing protein, partial [Thermoguttaceae bacterium]|nr:LysM peptidoglycan-binding domain-containing protein [Thermoguttaceae bacterium]
GDTLSLIAERLLGDSSRWPEIYRLNADKVRDMDLVPAGVKLLIPADDAIPEQSIWQ